MALEYEVRDQYKDYTVSQLLEAPVNCFQGVGDTQSEILERYFGVRTVQDLAHLPYFLQALAVQETVLENGERIDKTVDEAAQQKPLDFAIRDVDRRLTVGQLPQSPVHVLEGMSPAQDLALYDAFRITSLAQLAHNRIMLEARIIDYLAQQSGEGGVPSTEAVASILGTRQATPADVSELRERADEQATRAREMAEQVSEHVRDRLNAMRDRVHDRSVARESESPREGRSGAAGFSRMDMIRESRERGGAGTRAAELEHVRGASAAEERTGRATAGRSRVDDILASRSAVTREPPTRGGATAAGRGGAGPGTGDRVAAILAAREGGGGTEAGRTATATATATRTSARPGTAAPGRPAQRGIPTEEEIREEGAEGVPPEGAMGEPPLGTEAPAAPRRTAARPRRAGPGPGVWLAAAVVLLILIAALVVYLMMRGGEGTRMAEAPTEPTQEMAEPSEQPATPPTAGETAPGAGEQGTAGMAGTGTEGAGESAAGTPGAESQTGTAGQMAGVSGAAAGTGLPPGIKTVREVSRGDTLWDMSGQEYQDPFNWPSIYMENSDRIDNPDLIYPRQEFRIPAEPKYRFPQYPEGYRRSR